MAIGDKYQLNLSNGNIAVLTLQDSQATIEEELIKMNNKLNVAGNSFNSPNIQVSIISWVQI